MFAELPLLLNDLILESEGLDLIPFVRRPFGGASVISSEDLPYLHILANGGAGFLSHWLGTVKTMLD